MLERDKHRGSGETLVGHMETHLFTVTGLKATKRLPFATVSNAG